MTTRPTSSPQPGPGVAAGSRRWLLWLVTGTVLAGCGVKGRPHRPKGSPPSTTSQSDEIERVEELP